MHGLAPMIVMAALMIEMVAIPVVVHFCLCGVLIFLLPGIPA
jgi:hypothetical protein